VATHQDGRDACGLARRREDLLHQCRRHLLAAARLAPHLHVSRAVNAADLLRQISKDTNSEQIQVDGGTEFRGTLETACKEIGLRLFVLTPRSSKLNGHIESADAMIVRELLNFWASTTSSGPTAEISTDSCPTTTRCDLTSLSDSKHPTIGSRSRPEEIARFCDVLSISICTRRPSLVMDILWPALRSVYQSFSFPQAKQVRMSLTAVRSSGTRAVRRCAILRRCERSARLAGSP